MKNPIGVFQAFGIELEYMIVDRETLRIAPISDQLLEKVSGNLEGDFDNGRITWSNELVLHVIELKTSGPDTDLTNLALPFQENVRRINELLIEAGAMLLPTGMHPFMSPSEKRLWPHDNNEIYEAYDRIFDCRGHGWSNLQSMHINLPFANDEEFARLHTAVRFLLPVLPALTASSPLVENKTTGYKDSRLLHYQQNQKRIPSIAGQVIPELARSRAEYQSVILNKTYEDIASHDPLGILREDWLNSRGAIARFGRQTIEIRILDTQECPAADLAIAEFTVEVLKTLYAGKVSVTDQANHSVEELKAIFDLIVRDGETALISNEKYLGSWGFKEKKLPAGDFWKELRARHPKLVYGKTLDHLLDAGSLATRIQNQLAESDIPTIYRELSACLEQGRLFHAR